MWNGRRAPRTADRHRLARGGRWRACQLRLFDVPQPQNDEILLSPCAPRGPTHARSLVLVWALGSLRAHAGSSLGHEISSRLVKSRASLVYGGMGRERLLEGKDYADSAGHLSRTPRDGYRATTNGELSFPLHTRRQGARVFGLSIAILARRSEEQALRRLFDEHEGALRRLAHSMLKDRRDVEEVVLDTFAKAHAARGQYRAEAAERTWLHRICFNLCVDRLRSRRGESTPLDPEFDVPDAASEPELRLFLWQVINDLPVHLQAPFKLKYAGYSVTEIAELAGLPRTTVSGHYNAACERLRARLGEQLDGPSGSSEGSS
jgi:RNA polymerase sigma-70 factor (ECF subfamily)